MDRSTILNCTASKYIVYTYNINSYLLGNFAGNRKSCTGESTFRGYCIYQVLLIVLLKNQCKITAKTRQIQDKCIGKSFTRPW